MVVNVTHIAVRGAVFKRMLVTFSGLKRMLICFCTLLPYVDQSEGAVSRLSLRIDNPTRGMVNLARATNTSFLLSDVGRPCQRTYHLCARLTGTLTVYFDAFISGGIVEDRQELQCSQMQTINYTVAR